MDGKRTPIQNELARMRGMSCFVCAPRAQNPIGLALDFEVTENGAKAALNFGELYQSYPGIVHGGVISAALDETMAYAIILKTGVLPFTSSLKLDYRLPVKTNTAYVCEGRVVSREGDGFKVEGRLKTESGRAVVLASAEFICPTAELAKRLVPHAEWAGFEKYLASV